MRYVPVGMAVAPFTLSAAIFVFCHASAQTAVGVFERVAKVSAVDFHASDGVALLQGVALNKDLHLSVVLVGLYFEESVHAAALHVF